MTSMIEDIEERCEREYKTIQELHELLIELRSLELRERDEDDLRNFSDHSKALFSSTRMSLIEYYQIDLNKYLESEKCVDVYLNIFLLRIALILGIAKTIMRHTDKHNRFLQEILRINYNKMANTIINHNLINNLIEKFAIDSARIEYKRLSFDDNGNSHLSLNSILGLCEDEIKYVREYLETTIAVLQDNDKDDAAYRLMLCEYNIIVEYSSPESTVDSILQYINEKQDKGEYEFAVLIYANLLYVEWTIIDESFRSDTIESLLRGISQKISRGGISLESYASTISMGLAGSLGDLAERCEVVSMADQKPFAVYDVNKDRYRFLAIALREMAISILYLDKHSQEGNNAQCLRLMAVLWMQKYLALGVEQIDESLEVLEMGFNYSKEYYTCCESQDKIDAVALEVMYLLCLLKTLTRGNQDSLQYNTGEKKWKEYLSRLRECILNYYDELKDYAKTGSIFPAVFISENLELLTFCITLPFSSKTEMDYSDDLVLQLVGIAINAYEFNRSRLCFFPTKTDYITDRLPCKLTYPLIGGFLDIIAKVYRDKQGDLEETYSPTFIKAPEFNAIYRACVDEYTHIGLNSNDSLAIASYTSLDNAYYLFEKIYRPAGYHRALTEAELRKFEESRGATSPIESKNCLTVMHASYMNDPNEGITLMQRLGCSQLRPFAAKWNGVRDKIVQGSMVFLKSFTTHVDQLHMWGIYGRGVSQQPQLALLYEANRQGLFGRITSSAEDGVGDCDGCCVCFSRDMFAKSRRITYWKQPRCEAVSDEIIKDYTNGITNDRLSEIKLYRVLYIDNNGDISSEDDKLGGNFLEEIRICLQCIDELIKHVSNETDQLSIPVQLGITEDELFEILISILGPIAFLVKDNSYSKEGEIRLLYRLSSSDDDIECISTIIMDPMYRSKLCLRPFSQVCIDKIILGPRFPRSYEVTPQLMKELNKMKKSAAVYNLKMDGKVRLSKIDYR